MKNIILIAGILLFFSACKPKNALIVGVSFNQPQPEGINNLKEIPTSYSGNFYDKDYNLLKINKDYFILKYVEITKISKHEADTTKDYQIENQHILIKSLNIKWPFTTKDDTLYLKHYYTDTLYNFKTDVIRKFKGYLILNKKYDDLWSVQIFPEDIFEKLTKISNSEVQTDETKTITVKRFLKPTRKQFENLLNYKDSLSVVVYKKVRIKD
jgi:hypothetical protein